MKRVFATALFLVLVAIVVANVKGGKDHADYHYSYFSDKAYFDQAYEKAESLPRTEVKSKPVALLVNQHLLASHLIAKTFSLAESRKVKTVFLITQNNWTAGRAPVITSLYDWRTPYGDIKVNRDAAKDLIAANLASQEEDIFANEHGITGIVPFVKKSFPNARIVPLVIRDSAPKELSFALAQKLFDESDGSTLVIASIDMSHYLPKEIADFHDIKVREAIANFDYDSTMSLDIDTPPTLRTLMRFAELSKAYDFEITGEANSADLILDPDILVTTSYITGIFSKAASVKTPTTITVLAMGDLMLDRNVRRAIEREGPGYPFKNIERFFLGNDITVANLEGGFTSNESVAMKDNTILHFTFDPSYIPYLRSLGFDTFSLANNHSMDFGNAGLRENTSLLKKNGFSAFGSAWNESNLSTVRTIRGQKIAFVGYHEFYDPEIAGVIKEIQRLKNLSDFIIVYPHWGVEYNQGFTKGQQEKARAFIDAGADAVIGAHPHVIEPIEIYKGKAIFYSLGNFLFDQDFSKATQEGLVLGLEIGPEKVAYNLFPVTMAKAQISFPKAALRQSILKSLSDGSNLMPGHESDILQGKLILTK